MQKHLSLIKLVLIAIMLINIVACNEGGATTHDDSIKPVTPDDPGNIHTGFTYFTLQNVATFKPQIESLDTYNAVVSTSAESTQESDIYFKLPQDALANKLVNLNKLYPIVLTNQKESVYLGKTLLALNTDNSSAIDFTIKDNLIMTILKPGQSFESGKVFKIHIESSESANVLLPQNRHPQISLQAQGDDIAKHLNIALTTIDQTRGIINSLVSYAMPLDPESIITLCTELASDEYHEHGCSDAAGFMTEFYYNSKINKFIAYQGLNAIDGHSNIQYLQTLSHAKSDADDITDFFIAQGSTKMLDYTIDRDRNLDIIIASSGDNSIQGKTYIASLGKSIVIGSIDPINFNNGMQLKFTTNVTNITVEPYEGNTKLGYSAKVITTTK